MQAAELAELRLVRTGTAMLLGSLGVPDAVPAQQLYFGPAKPDRQMCLPVDPATVRRRAPGDLHGVTGRVAGPARRSGWRGPSANCLSARSTVGQRAVVDWAGWATMYLGMM